MQLAQIDIKKQYQKKFGHRRHDRLLEFIFDHRLFPRKLYVPTGALLLRGYLSFLLSEVWRASLLDNERDLTTERLVRFSFGENLLIRNQDEIFQEKGKLIFTEYGPQAYKEVDKELARLYPEEKARYLALDAVTIGGKPYSMLLQVGFLRKDRLLIGDTLPMMDDVILPGEKSILSPVVENILEDMLSSPQYCYLN